MERLDLRASAVLPGLLLALAGCAVTEVVEPLAGEGTGGSSAVTSGSAGGQSTSGSGGSGPTLPDLAPGWNEFIPGGETICSRGTEYAYWVRPGTQNKVIIDFIGGGACWDEFT